VFQVYLTIQQIRWLMDFPHNIRNICVIGHVDHGERRYLTIPATHDQASVHLNPVPGRSTLTDQLISAAAIIKRSTTMRYAREGTEVTPTVQAASVSLHYEMPHALLEGWVLELATGAAENESVEKAAGGEGTSGAAAASSAADSKGDSKRSVAAAYATEERKAAPAAAAAAAVSASAYTVVKPAARVGESVQSDSKSSAPVVSVPRPRPEMQPVEIAADKAQFLINLLSSHTSKRCDS
jgi:hypothetical protein